jgi:hypothetical protein
MKCKNEGEIENMSLKQKIMESSISLEEINAKIIVPLLKAKAKNEYHTELYEHWLSENRVFKLLDEAQTKIQKQKVGILEMFCQQGPPTKHWIETKGQFWEGWNKAIDRVLAVLVGEKKEVKP